MVVNSRRTAQPPRNRDDARVRAAGRQRKAMSEEAGRALDRRAGKIGRAIRLPTQEAHKKTHESAAAGHAADIRRRDKMVSDLASLDEAMRQLHSTDRTLRVVYDISLSSRSDYHNV